MDSFSKIEIAVGLTLGCIVAYFAYKAYQGASSVGSSIATSIGDARDMGVRAFNQVGQTVKNTSDNARLSVSDALFSVFGTEATGLPGATPPDGSGSASQNMASYNSAMTPNMLPPGDGYYTDQSYSPDDFPTAATRMAKPSLEFLNQPPTDYVVVGGP